MMIDHGRTTRVLVCDDEPRVRELFADFLALMGYRAEVACDGAEALALFAQHPYDLVVTDLLMPGLNGLEIAAEIRQRAPTVPVILVSGSSSPLEQGRCRQEGLAFLPKPVRFDDFRDAIHRALSHPGRAA